ncbi:MAG: lactate racemase domain-containing protein [Hyphomicrobiales bacterium]
MKTVLIDYGDGKLPISVPDDAYVVEKTKPRALKDPEAALRKALAAPVGLPPIKEWVKPGSRVVIAFDDPTRAPFPRQLAIPVIIEQLVEAGVKLGDILLVSAGANHRKYSQEEFRKYLGPRVFSQFEGDPSFPRIINHDASDPDQLVTLGASATGDFMQYNRCLVDYDHIFYCGTVGPNNWGGITGIGVVNGLAGQLSVRATHRLPVIDHKDAVHANPRKSRFMRHKAAMMARVEEAIGKKVFYVDAFMADGGGIADFVVGHSPEINEIQWSRAEELYQTTTPEADILICGLPGQLNYSDSDNQLTFVSCLLVIPRMWVNKPMLREGGVIIGAGKCRGIVETPTFTPWLEVLKLWDNKASIRDLSAYEESFLHRQDLIHAYRHDYGYHPLHGFWLMYECRYAYERASRILMAGKVSPLEMRRLNVTPVPTVEEALASAMTTVRKKPSIVVIPDFWSGLRAQFRVE